MSEHDSKRLATRGYVDKVTVVLMLIVLVFVVVQDGCLRVHVLDLQRRIGQLEESVKR